MIKANNNARAIIAAEFNQLMANRFKMAKQDYWTAVMAIKIERRLYKAFTR